MTGLPLTRPRVARFEAYKQASIYTGRQNAMKRCETTLSFIRARAHTCERVLTHFSEERDLVRSAERATGIRPSVKTEMGNASASALLVKSARFDARAESLE